MSLALLSLVCIPASLAAVIDLPVRFQNGYSMVEVRAGTPPVSHSLLFDTGSATTWMITAGCDGTDDCPNNSGYNRTGYDASVSSTSEALNIHDSIDYLGGETTGSVYQDVFSFPSAGNTSWTQSFLAANATSWFNIPADGFLGMAFNTIATENTTTVVETLMQEGLLDQPRFALYYGLNTDDTTSSAGNGTLTLGGSQEDIYVNGNMSWAPLAAPGDNAQLWRVDMQYMTSTKPAGSAENNSTTTTIPLSGAWGVFDTGAGRIYVPDPYVERIYASIGMNYSAILNGDHIPLCTEFTDEWSVSLNFGDSIAPTTITLTGDMMRKPGFATGEDKYCWPPFDTSGSTGLFLFGGELMQKLYTVWDFGGFEPESYNARFGFGWLKDEYKPVVS